jgi:hypothetical protein
MLVPVFKSQNNIKNVLNCTCVGTGSVVDLNLFCRIRIHKFFFWIRFRIRILILIFWPKFFLNGASHCVHICPGICKIENKVFQLKKIRFILFQVFDLRFFTKFLFYYRYSVWIRIRIQIRTFFRIQIGIQPKNSDYLGFVSTTLGTGM